MQVNYLKNCTILYVQRYFINENDGIINMYSLMASAHPE